MALKMGSFSSSDLVTAHPMRRKYSIFTVTTSLSPLDLQTRNPTKSCWTQILRNTGFLSMQPPQTPAWPRLVRQHKNRDVGVCTYEAPCLFSSFPENTTRTGSHPSLSAPTSSCSQSQGCTSRALPPPQARAGTSKASSLNTREMSFCHFSALLVSQTEGGKFTYPYLIKINVTPEHHTEVLLPNRVFKERENPISFILSIFAKVCNSF